MTQQMEEMSITEHLSELRKRLIYVLSIFVLGLIAGFFVADPVYQYLTKSEVGEKVLCYMPSRSGTGLASI